MWEKYSEEFKRTLVKLHANGKTQTELVKQYGVSSTALSKWIKAYSSIKTESRNILNAKQIKQLQKKMSQLEEENIILKNDCHIHATFRKKLEVIHKLRNQHHIKTLYRVLRVNRSTYYKDFHSKPCARACLNQTIRKLIIQIYNDYDNSLGGPKIHMFLNVTIA